MNDTTLQVKLMIITIAFVSMIMWADKGLGIQTPLIFAVLGGLMSLVASIWIWGIEVDDDDDGAV